MVGQTVSVHIATEKIVDNLDEEMEVVLEGPEHIGTDSGETMIPGATVIHLPGRIALQPGIVGQGVLGRIRWVPSVVRSEY